MFNPLTQLNKFFDTATEQTLNGSDQLVYLHLFNKFNRARWPETILVRDAELHELCRLHSGNKESCLNTIRNAKARLKQRGLIDFTSGKGATCTEYRLTDLTIGTPVGTPVVIPFGTPLVTPVGTPDEIPNTRVRGDTLDVKTFSSSSTPPRVRVQAGACVNRNSENTPADSPAEKLAAYWNRTLGGARLNFEDISWLDALINRHGYEWAKDLLDEAYRANGNRYGLSPKWLHEVCERRLKPLNQKPMKGGAKNGGSSALEYGDEYGEPDPRCADNSWIYKQ